MKFWQYFTLLITKVRGRTEGSLGGSFHHASSHQCSHARWCVAGTWSPFPPCCSPASEGSCYHSATRCALSAHTELVLCQGWGRGELQLTACSVSRVSLQAASLQVLIDKTQSLIQLHNSVFFLFSPSSLLPSDFRNHCSRWRKEFHPRSPFLLCTISGGA